MRDAPPVSVGGRVVLLVLGVAVEAAKLLIWIGIAVLVVSLVLGLLGRGRSRV